MNLDNSHKKLRILLVDDSVHDFRAFKRAFEKSDVASDITHYAQAEPALQRILEDAASFDLVVTDYKLAGMNGLELCRELLRLEIPLALVMLTGSGTEDLAVEALKLGVDDYLIKDPDRGYFQLLPVVLPEAVKKRNDRLVRKLAEEQVVNLAKFPSENPNPVLRIAKNGELLYANDASKVILSEWQCQPGQTVPEQWHDILSEVFATGAEKRVEEKYAGRILSFSVAPVVETGYANIYGLDITERKKGEEEREVLLHDMGERNKELACMYTVAKSIRDRKTTAEILQDVADYIPPAWHYPEITRGKVRFGSDEFVSEPFEETDWKQTEDIVVNGKCCGSIEVYYLKERPELDEGPFMAEERNLINGMASAVSEGLERKEAEEQIENLAKFPSENPNPVLRIAKKGQLLFANDASRAILDEWQCEPGQTAPEQWEEILSEVFATGAEKRVEEEHAGRVFSFSVTPVGEAGYANIYGRDITERKRVQQEREQLMTSLEAKNRELQRFSSIVRHDFANPLVSIQGFSRELAEAVEMLGRLLQDEDIGEPLRDRACALLDDEIGSAVEFILKASDEMTKLLDGLRQIAAAGRVDINIEALDMSELIRQITGAMKFQIEESGASVQIGQLPPCCGDRAQIKQTFTNLLTNAIKYLEPGRPGQIQVYGNSEEDRVVYCVEDNGIGIPPAHQDKIFDMFHRVGVKEDITGEGLGLSIVGRIIDRHHGSISVDSQPGKGSRFYVTLPAVPELAAAHTNHVTQNQRQG